ncbi:hypothetical protein J2Z49_001350 [Desulfofundulus luciae]|uniref:Bacterial Pleckstrin homology domain-containing protein n=1 Tax=Desulfofundulus luciae TaxID=74702 RepID=A0ABU0B480_9FIRM|nr:PH domain-containing protein [Desulfofundulus luciae]MDQ0286238.1 hypothetical protein [Desulfofundulus luciae]
MASWDKGVMLWTALGLVALIPLLFIASPLNNVFIYILPRETYLHFEDWFLEGAEGYFAGGLSFSIIFLSYFFSPRGYLVGNHCLAINRLAGSISITYSSIHAIKIVENVWLSREIGVGGFWSWYGIFRTQEGDRVKVYATNLTKQMVQIKTTDGKTYYLSPAEPEKFVEAVKRHLNQNHQGGEKS